MILTKMQSRTLYRLKKEIRCLILLMKKELISNFKPSRLSIVFFVVTKQCRDSFWENQFLEEVYLIISSVTNFLIRISILQKLFRKWEFSKILWICNLSLIRGNFWKWGAVSLFLLILMTSFLIFNSGKLKMMQKFRKYLLIM